MKSRKKKPVPGIDGEEKQSSARACPSIDWKGGTDLERKHPQGQGWPAPYFARGKGETTKSQAMLIARATAWFGTVVAALSSTQSTEVRSEDYSTREKKAASDPAARRGP